MLMRWIVKALAQKSLSVLPGGPRANYYLQRFVTKKLPIPERVFWDEVENAFGHIQRYILYKGIVDLSDIRLFEFGAGSDLHTALLFAAMGVKQQLVVDVKRLLRTQLCGAVIDNLKKYRSRIEAEHHCRLNDTFFEKVRNGSLEPEDFLLEEFGIDYRAPFGLKNLQDGSFDLITNSSVLEHIPADDVQGVLQQCRRVLKPGGCLSSSINLTDHFVSFDPSISPYNFLKFSDRTWSFVNSHLHYQNRLRAGDYKELFCKAGFKIVTWKTVLPQRGEFDALKRFPLNRRFQNRDIKEDISVQYLHTLCVRAE
jgi:SAM-dependent methyltransferase